MNLTKLIFSLLILLTGLAGTNHSSLAAGKKYQRALVISGGGISPGVAIGMIAGAQASGWNPDVVITTCGAAIGATMYNSFLDGQATLEFAKSEHFEVVLDQLEIDTKNALHMKRKFDTLHKTEGVPTFFDETVLYFPEVLKRFLPRASFNRTRRGPRFVVIAAKAKFGPQDVGQPYRPNSYSEVAFTDPDTGAELEGMTSPIKRMFPESFLSPKIMVRTDVIPEHATRASFSDPFLINPGRIDDDYYFTGAVDLYPIDMAHRLADEVLVTYPDLPFKPYEDFSIQRTFGFEQSKAAYQAVRHRDVKWIDLTGNQKFRFDPKPVLLTMTNRVPKDSEKFATGIQKQFDFGFARAQEAVAVSTQNNVRTHLRKPVDPVAFNNFLCESARVWKTSHAKLCTSDAQKGCNRQTEKRCTPLQ